MVIGGCKLEVVHGLDNKRLYLFGVALEKVLLIRSAPIDTTEKMIDFLKFSDNLYQKEGAPQGKMRLSSLQLNTQGDELMQIQQQHYQIIEAIKMQSRRHCMAHISLPTELLIYHVQPRHQSKFLQTTLLRMQQQFNAEACLTYSTWFCDEIDKVQSTFHLDQSELFTLEAHFDNFRHEVHSLLLNALIDEIENILITQMNLDGIEGQKRVVELDKKLVALREKLQLELKELCIILHNIIWTINIIEEQHPELKKIKRIAMVLHALTASQIGLQGEKLLAWGQSLLLIQMLDIELGVISAVNCATGLQRTNLVFAICLALVESAKKLNADELFAHCMVWGEDDKGVFAQNFKELVWKNYSALHIGSHQDSMKEGAINFELASFLPLTVHVKVQDEIKEVALFKIDAETGKPVDFTEAGKKYLGA